jgi:hypothetical protein
MTWQKARIPLLLILVVIPCVVTRLPVLWQGFFSDDYVILDIVRGDNFHRCLWQSSMGVDVRLLSHQLVFALLGRLGHESPLPFHIFSLLSFAVLLVLFFCL